MSFHEYLNDRFGKGSTHRSLKPVESYSPRRLKMRVDGQLREFLNFSSNDYLALSQEKCVLDIMSQPSSRLAGGNLEEHLNLEERLSDWQEKESGLIYPTGYMANMGAISALMTTNDILFVDELCHASLWDGILLSKAKFVRYRHLDLEHLNSLLKQYSDRKNKWVISESLFSMDGDLPNFQEMVRLKSEHGFYLWVDEAHGIGIYDHGGRGFAHEQGCSEIIDVLTFNFSKAFALQGGIVMGIKSLKNFLINRSRAQIYTTATPIYQLKPVEKRLDKIKNAELERNKLKSLSLHLEKSLGQKRTFWSPIIPILIGDEEQAKDIAQRLLKEGIYCPAILHPTVPKGQARLRVSLNAAHEREDIERLLQILKVVL